MENEKEREGEKNGPPSSTDMSVLLEECIANIVSMTNPKDACRMCAVSPIFRVTAESNIVWERFFPFDYQAIIARSSSSSLNFSSKKHLYHTLSYNPILIDDAKKSFFLDKLSGKKCYLIAARDLFIVWGQTTQYWRWVSLPESRFPEVAELKYVWWFEISVKMRTSILSPKTNYTAYLVFKLTSRALGFDHPPPEASVGITGGEFHKQTVCMELDQPAVEPSQQDEIEPQQQKHEASCQKQRKDGWLEIELGEFFNEEGEDELQISLMEVSRSVKGGLIVEGIEIRPTNC